MMNTLNSAFKIPMEISKLNLQTTAMPVLRYFSIVLVLKRKLGSDENAYIGDNENNNAETIEVDQ